MYAASCPEGAFTESLQGFRPTTAARAAAVQASPGAMLAGSVPRDWRDRRRLGSLTLSEPADFIDVEAPSSWPLLENALAEPLNRLGVKNLDVSVLRGPNKLVTRLIARWAYLEADTGTGTPLYGGIRYVSKLGEHEC